MTVVRRCRSFGLDQVQVVLPSGDQLVIPCQSMTAYSYDPMGRTIETLNSLPTFPTTQTVYAVSAAYDLAGDRTSLTNSTGRTFNYSYDCAGRLQTASNTVSLNATPVATPMVSSMTYFPSGQPQTMTTDTGSATITGTWGIDKRLRVTSYQNLSTASTPGTNYGYSLTYTPNSNVLTDAETVYNPASGAMSWSWNFGYDTLNRLTSAQSTGAISFGCGWAYDGFGNRLSQKPSGTGLSCTSLNSPVNANNHLSNPIYNYDAAGDILTEGGNTLTYDAEGRIITGVGAFGTTTYEYGGDGQRVNKTFGSFATEYIRDPDGALVATYVNGSYFGEFQDMWVEGKNFGEVSVASGNASQTQNFALNNWLGSLVAYASPSSGIPNNAYVSQPFGDAQTTLFGSNNDSIRFTGKEIDGESGNNYFGARYYGSSMGRWMSPDWSAKEEPVPYAKLDNPQSLNLYAYVGNNPLSRVDPDGHACTAWYGNSGWTGSSGFCDRAAEYARFDASPAINSRTRFFGAAATVSNALGDVDAWRPGTFITGVSNQTRGFLEGVGRTLQSFNEGESHLVATGALGSGPALDRQLVHNEQSVVQGALDGLKSSDPKAYDKTIGEINGSLNGLVSKGLQQLAPSDRAYAAVLQGVTKDLGHSINFANQGDREAIGNALAQNLRNQQH